MMKAQMAHGVADASQRASSAAHSPHPFTCVRCPAPALAASVAVKIGRTRKPQSLPWRTPSTHSNQVLSREPAMRANSEITVRWELPVTCALIQVGDLHPRSDQNSRNSRGKPETSLI